MASKKEIKYRCALFTFLVHKHDWIPLADRTRPQSLSAGLSLSHSGHNRPAQPCLPPLWTPRSFLPVIPSSDYTTSSGPLGLCSCCSLCLKCPSLLLCMPSSSLLRPSSQVIFHPVQIFFPSLSHLFFLLCVPTVLLCQLYSKIKKTQAHESVFPLDPQLLNDSSCVLEPSTLQTLKKRNKRTKINVWALDFFQS